MVKFRFSLSLIFFLLLLPSATSEIQIIADSENIKHEKFDWKLNLIPFVGQIKNKKYIKTAVLATLQSYSLYNFYDYHKI